MKSRLLIVAIVSNLLAACEGKLFVEAYSNLKKPTVVSVDKDEIVSGEVIKISGNNLANDLQVSLVPPHSQSEGDRKLGLVDLSLEVETGRSATLTIPELDYKGIVKLTFTHREKVIRSIPLLINVDSGDIVAKPLRAEEICDDTFYKDESGTLVKGLRRCGLGYSTCSGEGEVDCLATFEFPAVERAEISSRLLVGKDLAGESGSVEGILPDCSSDGQLRCSTVATFPAIDLGGSLKPEWIKNGVEILGVEGTYPSLATPLHGASAAVPDLPSLSMSTPPDTYEYFDSQGTRVLGTILDGGTVVPTTASQVIASGAAVYSTLTVAGDANLASINIKDGLSIFGVSGSLTGAPPTCANDGDVGCLVDGTNHAAAGLSNAANKILSGQILAGVGGNVTLPSVGLVLTGTSYGVGATANTGTLTLPSGANVRTGSGLYGNPSAQITPSYSPDFPSLANVRSVDTVDGVAGTLLDCADGESGCVAVGPAFAAAVVAGAADKLIFGQSLAGVSGNVTLPAAGLVLNGTSYGVSGTGVSGTLTLPSASDVRTGSGLFGNPASQITPSYSPDFPSLANVRDVDTVDGVSGTLPSCADGATDCVASSPTFAAATIAGIADKILFGQSIAGVAGNVTLPSVGLVLTGTSYGVSATANTGTLTLPSGANVRTGSGLYGNPSAQITPSYSPDFPLLANVRSVDTVDGVTGTLLDCADGDSGCVAVGPAFAAAVVAGAADKLIFGQSLAGVSGNVTLPAAGLVLNGTSFGISGTGVSGTLTLPSASNVKTGSGLFGNPASQITPSYSPDFPSLANVRDVDTVDGASGTLVPCAGDNGANCFATAAFPSVVAANVTAGVIKSGTVIAGVTGVYPNAANPLPVGDIHNDLDGPTFNAQIKVANTYGWFNREGTRMTVVGDSDIDEAKIGSGTSIFGTNGLLTSTICTSDGQTNCITNSDFKAVNTLNLNTWDIRAGKSAGGISGSVNYYRSMANTGLFNRMSGSTGSTDAVDAYDSVDDANNGGAFPSENPPGVAQATGQPWIRHAASDNGAGGGTSGDGLCNGSEACVFTDQITGLSWARPLTTYRTWEGAITYCEGSSIAGFTDWRVPDIKDMLLAHVNGIWSLKTKLSLSSVEYYWTATTNSANTAEAWYASLFSANVYWFTKTTAGFHTICVR